MKASSIPKVEAFVKEITSDRDPSHGFEHMRKVADNSIAILDADFPDFTEHERTLTEVAALVHDVCDHKYDFKGDLRDRLVDFLRKEFDEKTCELIINIVDRTSYSKENNSLKAGKQLDWKEVLGDRGCLYRDIVSDADKLEALGDIGGVRCLEYGYTIIQKENKSEQELASTLVYHLVEHSKEKLFRLKDEFIRTKTGKILAEALHKELELFITRVSADNSLALKSVSAH